MRLQEHALQSEIQKQAGAKPGFLLRRRQVGRYLAVPGNLGPALAILRAHGFAVSVVDIGDTGEADLQGFYPRAGVPTPVAIEVKSETGRLSENQVSWRDNVWTRRGGVYLVAKPIAGLTLAQSAKRIIDELV